MRFTDTPSVPARQRWSVLARAVALGVLGAALAVAAAGCGATPSTFRLDPVSSSGANPFTPPFGTDQTGTTPPPHHGGTISASTVGLFGGTQHASSCNPAQMVAFLQAHQDKAAAWAGVLGITPAAIPSFVNGLTPVILRSDTFVTNHGFVDGHATTVPAVLQAGTAVLVNQFGTPVTKCFCGNPLTPPPGHGHARFTGSTWPTFTSSSVTVIQASTVVINQFILVQPDTGTAFDRPRGTDGTDDRPAPPLPSPSGTGPSTSGSAGATSASWVVANCFADHGTGHLVLRGTVLVRNNDAAGSHSYQVTVAFGPSNPRYGETSTAVDNVAAGTTGTGEASTSDVASAATALTDGPIPCEITHIVDENQASPSRGATIPPPTPVPPSSSPSTPSTSASPSGTMTTASPSASPS
jgi:hypothetical protein